MKMRQLDLTAGSLSGHRRHRPLNRAFPARPRKLRIRTAVAKDGDRTVVLPKGQASRFIQYCGDSGVSFTMIAGVYSGLGSAARDLVLFDSEFEFARLQALVADYDRIESQPRSVDTASSTLHAGAAHSKPDETEQFK